MAKKRLAWFLLLCLLWVGGCTSAEKVPDATPITSVPAPTGPSSRIGIPMLVVKGSLCVRDYSLPLIDDVKTFMSVKDFDFGSLGTVTSRNDEEVPKEELAAALINPGATVYIEGMGGRIYVLDNGVLIPMHLRTEQ